MIRDPIPQIARVGPEGLGCLCGCVRSSWKVNHTRPPPPSVSLSPKRPRQNRGDSAASPAMWGGPGRSIINQPPHGASLSPKRPMQDRRDSGVSAVLWGGAGSPIVHGTPTWREYPPCGPRRTGGARVSLPLCGEELEVQSYPAPLGSVPIPQTAQAGPEGRGCLRRCVGRSWKFNHTQPP